MVGTASAGKRDLLTELGAVPVTGGEGVADRVRAVAPDGVDGVFDLVGGDALRAVAPLVDPARLASVADKPLVAELGGGDVPRDRSTAVLDALAALVASGDLDPWVRTVLPFAADRRGARARRGRARPRQGRGHDGPRLTSP